MTERGKKTRRDDWDDAKVSPEWVVHRTTKESVNATKPS
jgi:hypothetical protein